jgi:hypothetical protein|tara:strand:+ start:275 stop:661 length:387 start_codon:yes stop_codon:yes gene_type:complete
MSKQNFFSNLVKKDGKLQHNVKARETIYNKFVDSLPEGAKVEMFVSVSGPKGSNAQLAKVYVMLRELAAEIGYSLEEMKLIVKRKSGLCFNKDGQEYCKSFGDCDKTEMNAVIQNIIDIGDDLGSNLR